MANNVGEWSPTAGNNTSLGAVSLQENIMLVNAVNNAFREMMAQVATGISANAMMAAYAPATASGAAYLDFKEDTDNGTNRVRFQGPASTADITITLPAEAGTLGVVVDEDDMVSDSATKVPSQQSVKAYVDAVGSAVTAASQAEQETGTEAAKYVAPATQHHHASAAKCWGYVTYSAGTPTLVVSYNVTSIADTATGRLTVTIATDFSTANWAGLVGHSTGTRSNNVETMAAGSVILEFYNPSTLAAADPVAAHWAFFGDQ